MPHKPATNSVWACSPVFVTSNSSLYLKIVTYFDYGCGGIAYFCTLSSSALPSSVGQIREKYKLKSVLKFGMKTCSVVEHAHEVLFGSAWYHAAAVITGALVVVIAIDMIIVIIVAIIVLITTTTTTIVIIVIITTTPMPTCPQSADSAVAPSRKQTRACSRIVTSFRFRH
jgi:hypothetical protein